jgi:hypothetical protein
MKRRLAFFLLFACMTTFAPIFPRFASAQSSPAPETQKIEALIKRVGELKDAKFVRNGSTYGPTTAVFFLRAKWEANNAEIRTAWEFIDKIASASGTSGKPYLIRFQDGREINSRDFLIAELNKLELN